MTNIPMFTVFTQREAEQRLISAYDALAQAQIALIVEGETVSGPGQWARQSMETEYDRARSAFAVAEGSVRSAARDLRACVIATAQKVKWLIAEGDTSSTCWSAARTAARRARAKAPDEFAEVETPKLLESLGLTTLEVALVTMGARGERFLDHFTLQSIAEEDHNARQPGAGAADKYGTRRAHLDYLAREPGPQVERVRRGEVAGALHAGGSRFLYFWRVP